MTSPLYALCIDKTTDVTITKKLIVYCRYILEEEVETSFLQVTKLFDDLAVTIAE